MATVKYTVKGNNKIAAVITGSYAGDGNADLSDAVLIDRSGLTGPDGVNVPTYIRVDEITWSIGAGYDYFVIEFDDGTDEVIWNMQGQGYEDFRGIGGRQMSAAPVSVTEGDILGTTSGGAAGDTYSITLKGTLKT